MHALLTLNLEREKHIFKGILEISIDWQRRRLKIFSEER